MSSSILAPGKAKLSYRVSQVPVRYAGRRPEERGDPKKDLIRRMLYPSNIRNRATPVGTWRPDVGRLLQRAIPSKQAHETIERAWNLHLRHTRWKRDAELARKFECMRKAMEELEKLDSRLYMEANKTEDPRGWTDVDLEKSGELRGAEKKAFDWRIRGLFPREFRLPTDTPSRNGWEYHWKPLGQSG
jgi:large subunit ribosomal protein L40